jgi:thermostable 8-oxoguanine DNA glycosylase
MQIVRNLDNFLIILIQKLFDMMMTYTQIDNLNVTHSKHAYLNEEHLNMHIE